MTRYRYNWAPIVSSLLTKFQKRGLEIIAVNDGEETTRIKPGTSLAMRKQAVEIVTSVDDAAVGLQYTDADGTRHRTDIWIVLGNDANEILADWRIPPREPFAAAIDAVNKEFYAQWEGKPVPLTRLTAEQE